MLSAPCPTCPWRRSSLVGGGDIPGFSIGLMRRLSETVGDEDDFRPIMACHGSACDQERPCVGYVVQEGWRNLNIRIAAIQKRVDFLGMVKACEPLDLWPSFAEMLRAYEEAS